MDTVVSTALDTESESDSEADSDADSESVVVVEPGSDDDETEVEIVTLQNKQGLDEFENDVVDSDVAIDVEALVPVDADETADGVVDCAVD